ncbi:uncharacterized protein LOC117285736 isoform X2 [Fukomys damarensis]|uniref:uncharacterized protein LOC117285736 isoform X2 n=1 Tax=Fukomys damarensis TaxID=885580 RepID=UPI001454F166|nr:uncharacterized protein LOC117285736 isoform X2 [Fukomys damarensis]
MKATGVLLRTHAPLLPDFQELPSASIRPKQRLPTPNRPPGEEGRARRVVTGREEVDGKRRKRCEDLASVEELWGCLIPSKHGTQVVPTASGEPRHQAVPVGRSHFTTQYLQRRGESFLLSVFGRCEHRMPGTRAACLPVGHLGPAGAVLPPEGGQNPIPDRVILIWASCGPPGREPQGPELGADLQPPSQ